MFAAGVGKIGVWLFFVLSAYLITSNFLHRGLSRKSIGSYAISRILRIYPPFVAAVLIAFGTKTLDITSLGDVISVITLGKGPAHLWTIPVEFKFYFILPIIAWLTIVIMNKFGKNIAIFMLFSEIAIHQIIFPYTQLAENSIETRWYIPAFLFGCIGALVNFGVERRKDRSRTGLYLGLAILAAILISTPFMRYLLLRQPPTNDLMNKYLFFSFAWTAFIVTQIRFPNPLSRLLANPVFTKIGSWSYSIYLLHISVIIEIVNILGSHPYVFPLAVIAPIAAGCLLYVAIEQPMFRLKEAIQKALWSRSAKRSESNVGAIG